eukprot:GHVQ01033929.1.p1 GENE.GHVQ01033929.1~~GHVQ01033929.1.p1  ORF type:complete len:409 (+),score=38.51 GHVQ01033929.1:306-1532(+)
MALPYVSSEVVAYDPLIELIRSMKLCDLRTNYTTICRQRLCSSFQSPRESFNRWLMERRSTYAVHLDPLLPSPCWSEEDKKCIETAWSEDGACTGVESIPMEHMISQSLYTELLEEFPCRLPYSSNLRDHQRSVKTYAEAVSRQTVEVGLEEEAAKNFSAIIEWCRAMEGSEEVVMPLGICTETEDIPRKKYAGRADAETARDTSAAALADEAYQIRVFCRPLNEYYWKTRVLDCCYKIQSCSYSAAKFISDCTRQIEAINSRGLAHYSVGCKPMTTFAIFAITHSPNGACSDDWDDIIRKHPFLSVDLFRSKFRIQRVRLEQLWDRYEHGLQISREDLWRSLIGPKLDGVDEAVLQKFKTNVFCLLVRYSAFYGSGLEGRGLQVCCSQCKSLSNAKRSKRRVDCPGV